jgi:hypothetical protein
LHNTNSEGIITVPVDGQETVELTITPGENPQETRTVVVNPNTITEVVQTVDVDVAIEKMDTDHWNHEEPPPEASTRGFVASHAKALQHGELPVRGRTIHCNRFNGYLGDGKYYVKSKSPVSAARNFFQSDCDVALARSSYCLRDYGSNPYCALHPSTKNGKCSSNIVSHWSKYHKHTGWFSPSS